MSGGLRPASGPHSNGAAAQRPPEESSVDGTAGSRAVRLNRLPDARDTAHDPNWELQRHLLHLLRGVTAVVREESALDEEIMSSYGAPSTVAAERTPDPASVARVPNGVLWDDRVVELEMECAEAHARASDEAHRARVAEDRVSALAEELEQHARILRITERERDTARRELAAARALIEVLEKRVERIEGVYRVLWPRIVGTRGLKEEETEG